MTLETLAAEDQHYAEALSALRGALAQYQGLSADERAALEADFGHLRDMVRKLETGRVEIVLFGEIDVGKSALINALVGEAVTEVDVRGGWTREVWQVPWNANGYCVPGLEQSQVVLLDTPGINEVNGEERAQMARDAAARADVILFVTDSDLNETEYSALVELAAGHKPIVVALNKIDIYTPLERQRLLEVLREERLPGLVPAEDVVPTAANPLEREYIIESADGSVRSELRQPPPSVEPLKARLLEVLERDGKALLALNAAMYASDKSDRIAAIKVRLREQRANQAIMSYAVMKSVAVAVNPISGADVLGGAAVDVTMVVTLGRIYGIDLTWNNARELVAAIAKAAGWMMLTEALTHAASWAFKGLTLGAGTVLTALPQGAAAGYGSFIVGQAAKYYFEHGASWAGEAPKTVVTRILQNTDKESVLEQLKTEIGKKIRLNKHAAK
jgi:small GTP-binding protein